MSSTLSKDTDVQALTLEIDSRDLEWGPSDLSVYLCNKHKP